MAVSQKQLPERKFYRYKRGMEEVKEQGFYDEGRFPKDQRTKERHSRNKEEIITFLERIGNEV